MKRFIAIVSLATTLSSLALADSNSEVIYQGANSKITVVEFADFQCPFCLQSATNVIPQIIAKYGDSISVVFHNLPLDFHPQARPAAIAGVCANAQGQFANIYTYLYKNQAQLSDALYLKAAQDLGLNVTQFAACLTSPEAANRVDSDIALAKEFKVMGTPGFFLVTGDKTVRSNGSYPLDQVEAQIDALLKP